MAKNNQPEIPAIAPPPQRSAFVDILFSWPVLLAIVIGLPLLLLSVSSIAAITYFMFYTAPKGVPLWLVIFSLIILIIFARRKTK